MSKYCHIKSKNLLRAPMKKDIGFTQKYNCIIFSYLLLIIVHHCIK